MKLVDHGLRIGRVDTESGLAELEVRAVDRIEVEGVTALGIRMRVGLSFVLGQPPPNAAGCSPAGDEPRLAGIAPARSREPPAELVYDRPIVGER